MRTWNSKPDCFFSPAAPADYGTGEAVEEPPALGLRLSAPAAVLVGLRRAVDTCRSRDTQTRNLRVRNLQLSQLSGLPDLSEFQSALPGPPQFLSKPLRLVPCWSRVRPKGESARGPDPFLLFFCDCGVQVHRATELLPTWKGNGVNSSGRGIGRFLGFETDCHRLLPSGTV